MSTQPAIRKAAWLSFFKVIVVFYLLIANGPCVAQITQANTMQDVMIFFECADSTTLAVFDVDMVLVQPSDPAFQMANMKRYNKIAKSISQTIPKEKKEIFLTLMLLDSASILIEECTPHYLQQLSHKGIPTIALTANLTGQLGTIAHLELWKIQRLCDLGIDFRLSAPCRENHVFTDLPSYRGHYSVYSDGILFANGAVCSKGDLLIRFLQINQLHPKRVVFVDDREDNLKNVEEALRSYDPKIHFEGIHYLGAEFYPSQTISEQEFRIKWMTIADSARNLD